MFVNFAEANSALSVHFNIIINCELSFRNIIIIVANHLKIRQNSFIGLYSSETNLYLYIINKNNKKLAN